MRRLLFLFLMISSGATSQSSGQSPSSSPIGGFSGPGDRPSVCLERARSSINPNLNPMTKFAQALLLTDEIDEAGLPLRTDGSRHLYMSLKGLPTETTEETRVKFMALFSELPANFYTPWHFRQSEGIVIATPGDSFPGLYVINSGPWCGGSDEEWLAAKEKKYFVSPPRGGRIFYAFYPNGVQLDEPCQDDIYLTSDHGVCDLKISKNWAIVFPFFNRPNSE